MQHVAVVYIIPMVRFHAPARHSSRLGQRLQLALGAAAALAAISLSPGSAQAYVVTVGGLQYDVTTFTGSYTDNASKFSTPPAPGVMPWWNNGNLATDFARALGSLAGYPNGGSFSSPYFAFNAFSGQDCFEVDPGLPPICIPFAEVSVKSTSIFPGVSDNNLSQDSSFVYAQATLYNAPVPAVPGPLPALGAAAAFGFSRKLRKRIKLAPNALGSALPQA
jgi:hypothetical protein